MKCKHQTSKALDKVKLDLQLKAANLKPRDPKLFYADTLACHPMAGDECWVYFHNHHFVARGVILKKTPGTSDTHATWRIRIIHIDSPGYQYYKESRETFVRSQIWPTRSECYNALHMHLQQKIKENMKENKALGEQCSHISRLHRRE